MMSYTAVVIVGLLLTLLGAACATRKWHIGNGSCGFLLSGHFQNPRTCSRQSVAQPMCSEVDCIVTYLPPKSRACAARTSRTPCTFAARRRAAARLLQVQQASTAKLNELCQLPAQLLHTGHEVSHTVLSRSCSPSFALMTRLKTKAARLLSVNYHFTRQCNYSCSYW
jgi:hypothetical protein